MNKFFFFLLLGFFYFFQIGITKAQDSLNRLTLEFDFRLVPVMRSLYNDYDFYKLKMNQIDSDNIIIQTHNNFRTSYSARLNLVSRNKKMTIGFGVRYARSLNHGNFIRTPIEGQKLTENLVADYFGGNFRILTRPKNKGNNLKHGLTLGGGVLQGRSRNIRIAESYEELPSEPPPSKKRFYSASNVTSIDLGYKVRLYDLYLNYTVQYHYRIGKQLSLFAGFELPLTRFFIFNNKGRFGVSLNDESFFTQFESFTIKTGEQESANKNFAYSMKKTNSFSLNFGVCYNFK